MHLEPVAHPCECPQGNLEDNLSLGTPLLPDSPNHKKCVPSSPGPQELQDGPATSIVKLSVWDKLTSDTASQVAQLHLPAT